VFAFLSFFFFKDSSTSELYPLSLHDALPILLRAVRLRQRGLHGPAVRPVPQGAADQDQAASRCDGPRAVPGPSRGQALGRNETRSEEHTSELQSLTNLVCRLLLEKKKRHKQY